MMSNIRFLGRFCGLMMGILAAFVALIALSLWMTQSLDGLFGRYYRTFPMMCVIVIGVVSGSQGGYYNIALGMNAGRMRLFWAGQVLTLLTVFGAMALAALLWTLGGTIGVEVPSFWILLPMGAGCLAVGEGGLTVAHTRPGAFRKAILVIYFLLILIVSTVLTIATAIAVMEQVIFGRYLTYALLVAVPMAIAVVLAAVDCSQMRKAVVS